MMNRTKIIATVQQIKSLVDALLRELDASHPIQITKGSGKTNKAPRNAPKNSLPGLILAHRDHGFFAKPKTAAQVHDQIKSTYHCDLNRVAVALIRLQKRKQLRKTSRLVNGKVQNAYAW